MEWPPGFTPMPGHLPTNPGPQAWGTRFPLSGRLPPGGVQNPWNGRQNPAGLQLNPVWHQQILEQALERQDAMMLAMFQHRQQLAEDLKRVQQQNGLMNQHQNYLGVAAQINQIHPLPFTANNHQAYMNHPYMENNQLQGQHQRAPRVSQIQHHYLIEQMQTVERGVVQAQSYQVPQEAQVSPPQTQQSLALPVQNQVQGQQVKGAVGKKVTKTYVPFSTGAVELVQSSTRKAVVVPERIKQEKERTEVLSVALSMPLLSPPHVSPEMPMPIPTEIRDSYSLQEAAQRQEIPEAFRRLLGELEWIPAGRNPSTSQSHPAELLPQDDNHPKGDIDQPMEEEQPQEQMVEDELQHRHSADGEIPEDLRIPGPAPRTRLYPGLRFIPPIGRLIQRGESRTGWRKYCAGCLAHGLTNIHKRKDCPIKSCPKECHQKRPTIEGLIAIWDEHQAELLEKEHNEEIPKEPEAPAADEAAAPGPGKGEKKKLACKKCTTHSVLVPIHPFRLSDRCPFNECECPDCLRIQRVRNSIRKSQEKKKQSSLLSNVGVS